MQPSDRKAFSEAMNQLFATYGMESTERLLTSWWGILSPYRLDAVLAGINLYVGDITDTGIGPRGHQRPTPADVKYHIEVTLTQLLKDKREAIVADARLRMKPFIEQIARADNDVRLQLLQRIDADMLIAQAQEQIDRIMNESEVRAAFAPMAAIRDEEEIIGPRQERLPTMVRRALGWIGRGRG